MKYGDGREYIVTKEEYDGQLFMRYCFLRNCKFKYVHLGDYEACGDNFEVLEDGLMVYDSRKQLRLFYYSRFQSDRTQSLNLEIYTSSTRMWRVKEMVKCLGDKYLTVLTYSKAKSKFCLCILKKGFSDKLEQLAFCKVQITGEDEFLRFSKLTVVGCDDD